MTGGDARDDDASSDDGGSPDGDSSRGSDASASTTEPVAATEAATGDSRFADRHRGPVCH
jgi:hypothetical protein